MTTLQTFRLRTAIGKVITKVGIQVTWKQRINSTDDGTGYGDLQRVFNPTTIRVAHVPISVGDQLLDAGYVDKDRRSIIVPYNYIISRGDEILWASTTYLVTGVQDLPAFGDTTNPGTGDAIAYQIFMVRTVTGT